MKMIKLEQRKIIIQKQASTHYLESCEEAMTYLNTKNTTLKEYFLISIFTLGLGYMEGKNDTEIKLLSNSLDLNKSTLSEAFAQIQDSAAQSNNRIENAIKEITKIALKPIQKDE